LLSFPSASPLQREREREKRERERELTMASRDAASSPKSAPRRHGPAAPKNGADLLSPRFRSAAALAGWDEESVLLAAMVVDDTPVRDSRRKRRASTSSVGGSAGSSTRYGGLPS
jgi:hypothetical protein